MFENMKNSLKAKAIANSFDKEGFIKEIRKHYEFNVTDTLSNPNSVKAIEIPCGAKNIKIWLDSVYLHPDNKYQLKGSFRYVFDEEELTNKVDTVLFVLEKDIVLKLKETNERIKAGGQLYPMRQIVLSLPQKGFSISLKELLGETTINIKLTEENI